MTLSFDLQNVESADIVGALMEHILNQINVHYAAEGVDLPERQYLNIGRTSHDCEQLTISFVQLYLGPPGQQAEQPQICNAPRTAVMTVQLVRKVAVNTVGRGTMPPDPEHITRHTMEKTRDAWLLLEAVTNATDDYTGGILVDVAVTDQQGEYQAIVLNIAAGVP